MVSLVNRSRRIIMQNIEPIPAAKSKPKQSRAFIKVVEIWVPTVNRKKLIMVDGLFDGYESFEAYSQNRSFAYGEGLPGIAWSTSRPQSISNIAYSFFRRKEEAIKAGLGAGIAIPIFAGEFLQAVIVLLYGEEEHHSGAIELWGKQKKFDTALSLIDGYYGSLKTFEWVSKQLTFKKGTGLPGSVWQTNMPLIFPDLRNCSSFIRKDNVKEAGITTGFGIPLRNNLGEDYVLTLLSTVGSPIAHRFEIWIPDKERQNLVLLSSHNESNNNLANKSGINLVKSGKGIMEMVWMTGCPAISHNLLEDGLIEKSESPNLKSALVMPINEDGKLKALVNMFF